MSAHWINTVGRASDELRAKQADNTRLLDRIQSEMYTCSYFDDVDDDDDDELQKEIAIY